MRKTIAVMFAASTLLLASCSTMHEHANAKWEYRTYRESPTATADFDSGLNKLAAEGWTVDRILQSDSPYVTLLLKRHKQ
jgi:protein involved in sex pheromone biosynthesis